MSLTWQSNKKSTLPFFFTSPSSTICSRPSTDQEVHGRAIPPSLPQLANKATFFIVARGHVWPSLDLKPWSMAEPPSTLLSFTAGIVHHQSKTVSIAQPTTTTILEPTRRGRFTQRRVPPYAFGAANQISPNKFGRPNLDFVARSRERIWSHDDHISTSLVAFIAVDGWDDLQQLSVFFLCSSEANGRSTANLVAWPWTAAAMSS